ncbi:pyrophosphate-energized vacuolar membrane proton pump-like [Eucalyptus grandis]|uniref:pyrophosphate-energized vacuolar membrane proton pump-like n=1 Tax=Eucalyptus grandis TaxID=71139 RepID=UPI00192E798B|nr:pyrophosphate-energized vacuolar membrane proton pump-like [Eucalyptus grandis]
MGRKWLKTAKRAKQAEPGESRRSGERRLRVAVRDDRRIVPAICEVLRNGLDVVFAAMGGSFADSTGKLTFYSDLWRKIVGRNCVAREEIEAKFVQLACKSFELLKVEEELRSLLFVTEDDLVLVVGYQIYMATVMDASVEEPNMENIIVVQKFSKVLPEELPGTSGADVRRLGRRSVEFNGAEDTRPQGQQTACEESRLTPSVPAASLLVGREWPTKLGGIVGFKRSTKASVVVDESWRGFLDAGFERWNGVMDEAELRKALELEIAIPVCAVIGIAFSLALWLLRLPNDKKQRLTATQEAAKTNCDNITTVVDAERAQLLFVTVTGVKSFLYKEYQYVGPFVGAFAILIFLCLGSVERFSTQSRPCKFDPSNTCKPALATAVTSTVSFLLGAFTSVVSGFLGTKIAIYANTRTALEETNFFQRTSIVASRSGAVMGFLLAAIGLLMLYLAIYLFKLYYGNDWEGLFEAINGYGLGGSFMALFGRAVGGINAKAADVCHHLVQKIEPNIQPDDRNPAVIPNYVGDILENVAGMGPDLFASYAESSCAALVVASISSFGIDHDFTAMCYPLLISSMGILVCLITTLMGEIMPGLNTQLIISTVLMTGGIYFVSWIALPSSFTIYNFGSQKVVKRWQLSLCVGVGLWAGLFTGFVNEIHTKNFSNDPYSCRDLKLGDSVSVSLGSVSIPVFAAVCILVSSHFAGTYGIAVAALGMLSTIATRLAINAYGPISHSARGYAGTAGMEHEIPDTDACDASGNTAAATGKVFPIESAALVSIALFGAFVSRPAMSSVDVLTPKIIIGLTMGAWLPRCFSAMTMKSVGRALREMAPKVREKLKPGLNHIPVNNGPEYYEDFFKKSSDASVREVILPAAIVVLAPLVIGILFGVEMLSGVLAGSLSSVVEIAISASNTDEPWKKVNGHIRVYSCSNCSTSGAHVESGDSREDASPEDEELEKSIGDSQKDTSGPPLNILIQLMAVESLVFAPSLLFTVVDEGLPQRVPHRFNVWFRHGLNGYKVGPLQGFDIPGVAVNAALGEGATNPPYGLWGT